MTNLDLDSQDKAGEAGRYAKVGIRGQGTD